MTFITSDPTAPYRHALNAWVSPLATCALPKGVCYLLLTTSKVRYEKLTDILGLGRGR